MEIVEGAVEPLDLKTASGRRRAVRFDGGSRLILNGADEFSILRSFPREIGWTLMSLREAGGGLRISLIGGSEAAPAILFEGRPVRNGCDLPVTLDWPLWAARPDHRLVIESLGADPAVVSIGPLFDSRAKVRTLIRGHGVEVGPGLNPVIRPAAGIHVEYVEEMPPEVWKDIYGKGNPAANTLTEEILRSYRVGSALTLEEWAPASLDFVFSNHVIEHLMNPLQVLMNWMDRLKSGGVIAGAAPDARYTFDLRQPFSTLAEFEGELAAEVYGIPDEKYARWCRHTAPYNTPEDLRRRKYSIHVHYYTPEVFRILSDRLSALGRPHDLFLDTAPNNKDFGFAITKR